jgi:hypothetical protein
MSFREEFAKTPAGPKREQLIYETVVRQGKPATVPITVDGPGGTKITYKVMPDHVMVDRVRVPMTGITAQKIADNFGMQLPTAKMSQQIYDTARAKGTAISAKPLSGTGATINGKYYSPSDVVADVSRSEFSLEHSDRINRELTSKKIDPSTLSSGYSKEIVLSPAKGKLALYGLHRADGTPIQGGSGETPHGMDHSEYAAGARLVDQKVIVTKPDGSTIETTMSALLSQPNFAQSITSTPVVKKYTATSSSRQAGPPSGYMSAKFPTPEIASKIEAKAKGWLSQPMWTEIPFEEGGKQYVAKLEPHSNAPKGVSVYERASSKTNAPSNTPSLPSNMLANLSVSKPSILTRLDKLMRILNIT